MSYLPFDAFLCIFLSALYLEYPLEYNHDTLQLFRKGHDDVSCTRMTTLAFILSELFPLNGFGCSIVSTPYLEYPLVYYHDTLQLCRTGHDDVLYTRMATFTFILSELFPLIVSDAISCLLHNLRTLWDIIMILQSYVEHVLIMFRVQE